MLTRATAGPDSRAYLLLVLATFFWGGNFIVGRAAAGHVPPVTLAVFRWAGALLLILPYAWPHLRRDWPVIRHHLRYLFVLSAAGIATFNTLIYVGLERTTVIKASLLQSAQPLLIGVWSFILFSQMLTARQLAGIALSTLGVVGIVTEWSPAAVLHLDLNAGDLIIFAACVAYALYSAMLRRAPAIHWSSLIATTFAIGLVLLLPFLAWELAAGRRPSLDVTTLVALAYVPIFPSLLSYLCWNRGVRLLGPNRAGPFMHLVPLFGTAFAILILGETLHAYHVASFVLIFGGIAIATRPGRPAVPAGPAAGPH